MILYMAPSRYPLNRQVLAIFFPHAAILATILLQLFFPYAITPHYLVFTDRHSQQYGMLTFLLHFMTNTFFSTFLPLSSPPSASTLFLNHKASLVPCTPPSLTPLTKNNFSDPTPISPSHSPDLGCVGAKRIMFLGRFLV